MLKMVKNDTKFQKMTKNSTIPENAKMHKMLKNYKKFQKMTKNAGNHTKRTKKKQ
jgi:hypothetical protein